MGSDQAQILC